MHVLAEKRHSLLDGHGRVGKVVPGQSQDRRQALLAVPGIRPDPAGKPARYSVVPPSENVTGSSRYGAKDECKENRAIRNKPMVYFAGCLDGINP